MTAHMKQSTYWTFISTQSAFWGGQGPLIEVVLILQAYLYEMCTEIIGA